MGNVKPDTYSVCSSCHSTLAQRDKIITMNPGEEGVVTFDFVTNAQRIWMIWLRIVHVGVENKAI